MVICHTQMLHCLNYEATMIESYKTRLLCEFMCLVSTTIHCSFPVQMSNRQNASLKVQMQASR